MILIQLINHSNINSNSLINHSNIDCLSLSLSQCLKIERVTLELGGNYYSTGSGDPILHKIEKNSLIKKKPITFNYWDDLED